MRRLYLLTVPREQHLDTDKRDICREDSIVDALVYYTGDTPERECYPERQQ